MKAADAGVIAKRLTITAKTAEQGNPSYGIKGLYSVEVDLEKKSGKITCTRVAGVTGKLAIPMVVKPFLMGGSAVKLLVGGAGSAVMAAGDAVKSFGGMLLWGRAKTQPAPAPAESLPAWHRAQTEPVPQAERMPAAGWEDLSSYNTGSQRQNLAVEFKRFSENSFQFSVDVDPRELKLEGATAAMLYAYNMAHLAGSARIEGGISVAHEPVLSASSSSSSSSFRAAGEHEDEDSFGFSFG